MVEWCWNSRRNGWEIFAKKLIRTTGWEISVLLHYINILDEIVSLGSTTEGSAAHSPPISCMLLHVIMVPLVVAQANGNGTFFDAVVCWIKAHANAHANLIQTCKQPFRSSCKQPFWSSPHFNWAAEASKQWNVFSSGRRQYPVSALRSWEPGLCWSSLRWNDDGDCGMECSN